LPEVPFGQRPGCRFWVVCVSVMGIPLVVSYRVLHILTIVGDIRYRRGCGGEILAGGWGGVNKTRSRRGFSMPDLHGLRRVIEGCCWGRLGGDSSRLLPELWLPIRARSITGTGTSEVMPIPRAFSAARVSEALPPHSRFTAVYLIATQLDACLVQCNESKEEFEVEWA
jgi:hypothetical protein